MVGSFKLNDGTDLDFGDTTKYTASNDQTYYLALGVEELDQHGNLWVYVHDAPIVEITLVDKGFNVTSKDEFITLTEDYTSLVLHNDIVFTDVLQNFTVKLTNDHIYGNYFTVQAHKFYDSDRNTSNGYSLISMEGDSSLNQLIIDGPVYHTAALSASNIDLLLYKTNPGGFFAYGVTTSGTPQINDSYISGFNSPVRVNGGTFTANNTVFEGGAWSNLFIAKATEVTLKDCMTIQNRVDGYNPTFENMGKEHFWDREEKDLATPIIGMGIYVHGETMTSVAELKLDLTGTKQYNWVSNTSHDKSFGTYVSLAIDKAFSADNNSVLTQYKHGDYINVAIASLDVDVFGTLTIPSFTNVKIPDGSSVYPYIPNTGSSNDSSLKIDVWAMSYGHANSGCNCSVDEHGVNFTYGVEKHRETVFNGSVQVNSTCACRDCASSQ